MCSTEVMPPFIDRILGWNFSIYTAIGIEPMNKGFAVLMRQFHRV
jgi:hypothetical protein